MPELPGEAAAWLDASFVRLARRVRSPSGGDGTGAGAVAGDPAGRTSPLALSPPLQLERTFLERVEFLSSFPKRAIGGSAPGWYLPPATCFRLFRDLAGRDLPAPAFATLVGPCFRRESLPDDAHLHEFTMREVVAIAGPDGEDELRRVRDDLAEAALRLARRLGLHARLEDATDPFFTSADRGKLAMQRLLGLKRELVVDLDGGPVALASFNLHRDFLCGRLGIAVEGEPGRSMCAAFGLERWLLALRSVD